MKRAAVVVVVLLVMSAGLYQLMNANTFQLFGEITNRVETDERVVALTFDDGPTAQTRGVLDVLGEHDAAATFFLVGNELAEHPEFGKAIADAGHEVGNHSWSHQRMLMMGRSRIAEEIESTDSQIAMVAPEGLPLFRPPYGKKLFGLPRYLADTGRHTIMADVEPESDPEVAASADRITEYVVDHVRPGSIVVLHAMYDANQPTRDALPQILTALAKQGYQFVTVSDLLTRASGTAAAR